MACPKKKEERKEKEKMKPVAASGSIIPRIIELGMKD